MKYTKLPSMRIENPFSSNPVIKQKFNKALIFLKCVTISVSIFILSLTAYFLIIHYDTQANLFEKLRTESMSAPKSGVVIDTTTQIIQREGHLPLNVAKQYAIWIYDAAAKYAIDPTLILSIINVESGFNYKAISSGNAIGLMQIIFSYHQDKTTKADLFDPKNNIFVGTQIIKEYSDKSSNDIEALLRYNGSLGSAPTYAYKVMKYKTKFDSEIFSAMSGAI